MRIFAFIKWLIASLPIKIGFDTYIEGILGEYVKMFQEFLKRETNPNSAEIWQENIRNIDKFKTKYKNQWDKMVYNSALNKVNVDKMTMEEAMEYAQDHIISDWAKHKPDWPIPVNENNPEIIDLIYFRNLIMKIFENNLVNWTRTKGKRYVKQMVPYEEIEDVFEEGGSHQTFDENLVEKFYNCVDEIRRYLSGVSQKFSYDEMFDIIHEKVNAKSWTQKHKDELQKIKDHVSEKTREHPEWELKQIKRIMEQEEQRIEKAKISGWRRAYLAARSEMEKRFNATPSKLDREYENLSKHLKDFFKKHQSCGVSPEAFVYNIASDQEDILFKRMLASWVLGKSIADEIKSRDYMSPAEFVKELKSKRQKKMYSGECIADRIVASYLKNLS